MQQFGRYRILGRLSSGGMAEVYRAVVVGPFLDELERGREVVLKRVRSDLALDPRVGRMFLDEARVAALLAHPNVVRVLDFGCVAGEYFLAMEWVRGRDLAALLGGLRLAGERLPLTLVLHVAASVAAALQHAHELVDGQGRPACVVHRDVSPQNILVSYDGEVKLGDFGIAKALGRARYQTDRGVLKGKIAYMSPEQARGEAVDPRSDLFSLGIVLYEMLYGLHPFDAEEDLTVLERVRQAAVTPPPRLQPSLLAGVEELVLRLLAASPVERPQSAAVLVQQLEVLATATAVAGADADAAPLAAAGSAASPAAGALPADSPSPALELGRLLRVRFPAEGPRRLVLLDAAVEERLNATVEHGAVDASRAVADRLTDDGSRLPEVPAAEVAYDMYAAYAEAARPPAGERVRLAEDAGFGAALPAAVPGSGHQTQPLPRVAPAGLAAGDGMAVAAESPTDGDGRAVPLLPEASSPTTRRWERATRQRVGVLGLLVAAASLAALLAAWRLAVWRPSQGGDALSAAGREGVPHGAAGGDHSGGGAGAAAVTPATRRSVLTLLVTSEPAGAAVTVDGQPVPGATPLLIRDLERRHEHRIAAQHAGYRVAEQQIRPSEAVESLTLRLEPRVAELVVTSTPSGAMIFLDGKPRGRSPQRLEVRIPEARRLRLEKAGHLAVEKRLDFGAHDQLRVDLELPPRRTVAASSPTPPAPAVTTRHAATGVLRITTHPSYAEVYVDGALRCTTPCRLEVPLGLHQLRLRNPRLGREERRSVTVTEAHSAARPASVNVEGF